jgi:CDGSH-type Zn-finger protein
LLAPRAFVEDGGMEEAHVGNVQIHGEQRVRLAIARARVIGHEHVDARAMGGRRTSETLLARCYSSANQSWCSRTSFRRRKKTAA